MFDYKDDLITDMMEQVRNQQQYIDDMSQVESEEDAFSNKMYQMEIDRIKYMLASYLRIRIMKLEQHSLYYLKEIEMRERLSDYEIDFLNQFIDLSENHFQQAFLSKLPEEYQTLDSENMVQAPNLDHFVFCETTQDIGRIQSDKMNQIELKKGDRHVLRYRMIEPFLNEQKAKLI